MRFKVVYITLLLVACSGKKEDPIILESIEIYKSTMAIKERMVENFKQMNTLLDSLNEESDFLKDSLSIAKQDFIDWERSVVEVPGYEPDDEDHHDHDHDHDHSPPADLTPKMVFDIQSDIEKRAMRLDNRVELLLMQFESSKKQ